VGEVDIETGSGAGSVAAVGYVQYESSILPEDEAVLTESAKKTANSQGPTISYFGASYTVVYSEGQGKAQDEDQFVILAQQGTSVYSHRVQSEARVEVSSKAGGVVDGVMVGDIQLVAALDSVVFPYIKNPLVPPIVEVSVIPVGPGVEHNGQIVYDAQVKVNDYSVGWPEGWPE
jgi:hypothetical protein